MSIAVLPPIAASICARRVVGSWTKATPRRKVAATNPAEIADAAAAEGDDDAVPFAAGARHLLPEPPGDLERLGRLAVGHHELDERRGRGPQRGERLALQPQHRRARDQEDGSPLPELGAGRHRSGEAALAGDDPRFAPRVARGAELRRRDPSRPQTSGAGGVEGVAPA